MTRKLSVLILILVLAMVFTGCCKHEVWTDATCTTPKTCVECGEIEGEALGHIWQPRTTEVPETCSRCSDTRGERIITDPRFTTAATIDYYGTWKGHSSINTASIFENQFPKIRKTHVVVEYGKPIYPNELDKDQQKHLGATCQEQIEKMLQKNANLV